MVVVVDFIWVRLIILNSVTDLPHSIGSEFLSVSLTIDLPFTTLSRTKPLQKSLFLLNYFVWGYDLFFLPLADSKCCCTYLGLLHHDSLYSVCVLFLCRSRVNVHFRNFYSLGIFVSHFTTDGPHTSPSFTPLYPLSIV